MVVTREQVAKLYVATFNRAADEAGLNYWVNNSGLTIEGIAQSFFDQPETQSAYPVGTTNSDFVTSIYHNLFNRAPDSAGLAYWVHELDIGNLTKNVMIGAIVNGAQGTDVTILQNKTDVSMYFSDTLHLERTDFDLSHVTVDTLSVSDTMHAADLLVASTQIDADTTGANRVEYAQIFTLQKVVTAETVTTSTVAGTATTYWGDPDCTDCNITYEAFTTMLADVLESDVFLLNPIGIDGEAQLTNVTLNNGTLAYTTATGEQFTSELALGQSYLALLDSLIYYTDVNGTKVSRFTSKQGADTTETHSTFSYAPIVLTNTVNNGGTVEAGFTANAIVANGHEMGGNDLIVAGELELLHGAYIDGGQGYNTLEVDAKGVYAQPRELLNIQEVDVHNLPNVYGDFYASSDLNHDGVNIPDYLGGAFDAVLAKPGSILDLSHARELQKLVITEGRNTDLVDRVVAIDDLTIVGVRGNAETVLEGMFTAANVNVFYSEGLSDGVKLTLNLGDAHTTKFSIFHNSNTININSIGGGNVLNQANFGDATLMHMNISGTAQFVVSDSIANNFTLGHPAIIDAHTNTAGVDITMDGFSDEVVFTGTASSDDHFNASNVGKSVVINGGNGNNEFVADGSQKVTIISGDGANEVHADNAVTAAITLGNGVNTVFAENGTTVKITTGDGANTITTDGSSNVTITTGAGNDTISSLQNDVATIHAGSGDNVITAEATAINITTGMGNDSVVIKGPSSVLNVDLGAGSNTLTLADGFTAAPTSVITGSAITLVVPNASDLSEAALSGITSVVLTDLDLTSTLRLTDEQFLAIGAANFHVVGSVFSQFANLEIVVTSSTSLTALGVDQLSDNINLKLSVNDGVTLSMTAQQLQEHVAANGVFKTIDNNTDTVAGNVVIDDAGTAFDPWHITDAFHTATADVSYVGGSLVSPDFATSNVVVHRATGGYDRPTEVVNSDVITIDSTLALDGLTQASFATWTSNLELTGNHDITFNGAVTLGMDYVVDYSTLDANAVNLTLSNFQDVKAIHGNSNTGTGHTSQINVKLAKDGIADAPDGTGLVSTGVTKYTVTDIANTQGSASTATIQLCDTTQDLEVVALRGNYNDTLMVNDAAWGLAFELQGGGKAKAEGPTGTSNVGTLDASYKWAGAEAVVTIVHSIATDTRPIHVEGITINNAAAITVDAMDANTIIKSLDGNTVDHIAVVSAHNVTIETLSSESTSPVLAIDANAVDGSFTATLTTTGDFTFEGAQGGSALKIANVDATNATHINGATEGVTLTVDGITDLSAATLSHVNSVALVDGADLSLTMAQADAVGASHFSGTGTLNLAGLDGEPFAVANYASTITVGVVSLAAQPVVTLNAATDLTSITSLSVDKGTVLNLTAAQFQQLDGAGTITGEGTVNITGLTQADVMGGIDLSGIVHLGTVTMAESVTLASTDSLGTPANVVMGNDMSLTLADIAQADALAITGGTNSSLIFTDISLNNNVGGTIDASHFAVSELQVLNVLVANNNVDAVFTGLAASVTKVIYNGLGWVDGVNQNVVLDAGTTIPGSVVFNKVEANVEIENFILTMAGGTEISGDLNLANSPTDGLIAAHLKTVTINSVGTAVNLLNGATANVITGTINTQGAVANNLLDITIHAAQALNVEGGIKFESLANDGDGVTANDNNAATATLTVDGAANVNVGLLDTSDTDVDGLNVVNNSTGTLSVTLDDSSNGDALSFTGSNVSIKVAANSTVDLSADTLTAVKHIMIDANSTLTMTQAQFNAVGIANIAPDALDATTAHLNLVNVGSAPLDVSAVHAGIVVGTITLAAGNVTLDAATNLTGVTSIVVPEGSTLTLSAAQFQQLAGAGTITGVDALGAASTAYTVKVTGLTQADIINDLNHDGIHDAGESFVMTGITAATTTLSLASDVNLAADSVITGAAVTLAAGQTLGLNNSVQADGLVVNGGVNSTLVYQFAAMTGLDTSIDAAGYNVTTLKALATFVGGENVEALLVNVASTITERYYVDAAELGFVDATNRKVVVEAGVTVPDFLMYSDLQDTQEVRTLDMTLSGGSKINGDLNLSTTAENNTLVTRYFDTLTLHSVGTAANTITGSITAADSDGAGLILENNLLKVVINGSQNLVVEGNIVFTSVETTDVATDPVTVATLTINNTGTTTVHALDVTDDGVAGANGGDIETLNVINNGGTFTVTGGTPAITGDIETLNLSGTGNIVLGSAVASEGVTSSTISTINAAALSGNLTMGIVNNVDSAAFAFTAGHGITTMTMTDPDSLDSTNGTPLDTTDDTAGWTFNFANAAAGSELHLGAMNAPVDGSVLNINMGAHATLYVDASMDLSRLNLHLTQTQPIVLADGVTLTLTAAQANALRIMEGTDTGAVGFTGHINIIDLGDTAVDFSHITAIPTTVTLEDDNVTVNAASNLGGSNVAIQLMDLADNNNSLAGQTVQFNTVAQAQRTISVLDTGLLPDISHSSTNVVWLFNSVSAPVDTANYDAQLGRLWLPNILTSGLHNVENLFTTLPNPIIRADYSTLAQLNILLTSNDINRTLEVASFKTVANLTFSDIGLTPVENLHSLTIDMGGQATVGNILIDDFIPASGYSAVHPFLGVTINSSRALTDANILAANGYINDNDAINETAALSGAGHIGAVGNENTLPTNMNTVGTIGVDDTNHGLDLMDVTLATGAVSVLGGGSAGEGAELTTGMITFGTAHPAVDSTAQLNVTGANDITVAAINTADADITGMTIDATGFTGVLDPIMHMDDTQTLTLTNGNIAAGTITLEEIEGNELSFINAANFDGTLNMTLSQIDSTNEDRTVIPNGDTTDATDYAFNYTAGNGVETVRVAALNGSTPTLNALSTWAFDFTGALAGSTLTLTNSAVLAANSNLVFNLGNVPLVIEAGVNLSAVNVTMTGELIEVLAGATLTLTATQAVALALAGVTILGAGTVKLVGDASNMTLGANLKTATVDVSALTLIATPTAGFDIDATVALTALVGGLAHGGIVNIAQTIIGSANKDTITTTSTLNDTITGGSLNDALNGGAGNNTFNVGSGTDTITGLNTGDIIVTSATATANAATTTDFVATAATANNGTTVLTTSGAVDHTIDMHLATGANGFTITGGTSATLGADTLIGSSKADIINGGNISQTAAVAADILTGNGGADKFVFDVQVSSAATMVIATTTAAIDRENITVTADGADNNDETMTVNYSVNGIDDLVAVNLSAIDVMDANAVATAVAAALDAKAGISAIAAVNVITAAGDSGSSLTIGAITYGGTIVQLAGAVTGTGTDVAQVTSLTVSGTPTQNDVYSLIASGIGGAGGDTASATADANPTTAEIANGLNTTFATAQIASVLNGSVITFTDSISDNGGFTVSTDTTAAFGGSGASDVGAIDPLTADKIMDFVSGQDTISFGLAVGVNGANYAEGDAVANYGLALAAANTALDHTVQYYMTSVTGGNGYLFFDANLDGNVDGVVELVGLTRAGFAAGDIVA